ncbi:MAG TPA: trigger factor [Candidatus Faecousia gallistercoris]|nr:trigger factor [Candidatus Faecousia gallistercoris]
MNVKNIEKESSKAKITVEIERDLMDSGANQAYLKARKDIQLPGFRKGKAPRKLIESIYGAHVFYEDGLEEIFPQVYQFAVVEQELKAVGRPSLTSMDIAEDGSVTIVLETELYPEVTLGQYRGLEVEKVEPSVTDEEVEAELDRMAKNVASRETVERPAADGDTVNLDFEGFDNGVAFEGGKGEKFDLVLGSGSFIPGFEEQVVGMSAGEEKDIDVTFPADYHAKELAGKPVTFHIKVNGITVERIPEKDDEFAKDVSEFDTLEALRADIRAKQLESRKQSIERAFESAAVEKAAENATADIPEALVEEELDRQMNNFAYQLQSSGMTMEQYAKMMGGDLSTMRKALRPSAEKQAKVDVTLGEIVKVENLEVTDEEVEAEYQSLADTYHMELEKVRGLVEAESLKQDLLTRKAVKLIAEAAVPVAPKPEEETKTEE